MKFNAPQTEEQQVNITPLIDVVFILLIFFMVTTTFQKEAQVAINLPEAEQEPSEQIEQPFEVLIDVQGVFYVNGKELVNSRMDTIKNALRTVSVGQKDKPLIIRADARTPHQFVVSAMDAAAQLGLVRISIATTQPE